MKKAKDNCIFYTSVKKIFQQANYFDVDNCDL